MSKPIKLQKTEDVETYIEDIRSSAEDAQLQLSEISEYSAPLELFSKIKFEQIGFDPLNQQRSLNLIEQVNQTFTYLASFKAAKMLFSWHSGLNELKLNLGTQSGADIESDYDGGICAEVFAAVKPENNNKLKKDIEKVSKSQAAYKYVFVMCPGCDEGPYNKCEAPKGIKIWSLGIDY